MKNLSNKKRNHPENSNKSDSDNSSSMECSNEDSQIQEYVSEFKKEVEKKFSCSKTNSLYRFPRKKMPNTFAQNENFSDSLEGVTFYDLDSQNVKQDLMNMKNRKDVSETDFLVEVIKKLGKLDHRYLAAQIKNSSSTFFRILYSSVHRKANREAKSIDSMKSISIKTKPIVVSKQSSKFITNSKIPELILSSKNHTTTNRQRMLPRTDINPSNFEIFGANNQKVKIGSDYDGVNMACTRTHNSSASPHSHHSNGFISSKGNKKLEELKIEGNLRKNFSGYTCRVKSTLNKSASNVKQNSKLPVNQNNNSIFNLVKKNIINTNSNFTNSHFGGNTSKSRSKDTHKEYPVVSSNQITNNKNQISLTKEQLRSLIQKNIHKKTSMEADPYKSKNKDKSIPCSTNVKIDKIQKGVYCTSVTAQQKVPKYRETLKKIY
jgi:hypothetical protein